MHIARPTKHWYYKGVKKDISLLTVTWLLFGIPQGSVLRSALCTIYTAPFGRITQVLTYTSSTWHSNKTPRYDAISGIRSCVADIQIWMGDNFLKLSDDDHELLILTTHEEISTISNIWTKVGHQTISPSDDPPRNGGAIFDSLCCLDVHVAKLCKSISVNIYSENISMDH